MLIHYLKLAQKVLIKHKYYTIINVVGLVCGMISALIIAKYIGASLQLDRFHLNKNKIYSVSQEQFTEGNPQEKRKDTYFGVVNLVTRFPEVSDVTRYNRHVLSLVFGEEKNGNQPSFTENKIFVTDSSFFKIFTFPLLYGNPKTALARGNSMILTKSIAKKYFGNANPIGETLTIRVAWGKETTYEVTGVAEDIPKLSRVQFDFLITQSGVDTNESWSVPDCSVYLLLKENAKPALLAEKLTRSLKNVPQLKATNRRVIISLDSITKIQLSTEEYLLAVVAVLIAVVSWMNYINQIIAQSYWRVKQVGISRIMGATGTNLKMQFIVESSLVCMTSFFFIIGIYLIVEPYLQSFTNGRLLPLIGDPTIINIIFLGVFAIGVAVAATVQTVIHFSQTFRVALQNAYNSKIGSVGLRKALVVLQFSISTVLTVSIFVITDQLEYLKAKEKKINLNDVLVIKAPMAKDTTWYAKRKTLELFKQRCAELPFVTHVTSSTTIPSEEYRQETYLSLQGSPNKALIAQNGVDEHFFSLYDVKFVAGHDFIQGARSQNRNSIILNESAAKALGISDYSRFINAKLIDDEEPDLVYDITGIVQDYHKTSLKYEIRPMAFRLNVFRGHCSLKINRAALSNSGLGEGIDAIKVIWKETYPGVSFDHFFLSEKFEAQDVQDQSFGKLFRYFTILSVIISCLGLFGLSLLISRKRQKEIGIRKAFGASSTAILTMFLRGYTGPLSISVLIGCPVAYLMMNRWLENYAYRIEIGVGVIALAVGTLAAIFFFTVTHCTIKSATTNPGKVLRE
jgi:putative ABC transport system permease protein